jgi:hypothetical protein
LITGVGGFIVITKLELPVPPAFIALMFTLKTPKTVGDPEMTPITELKVSPAGKVVAP